MNDKIYFVYVLNSKKDGLFYIGFTADLEKRILEHNQGLVESTKDRVPFEVIYYECCLNKYDALDRERYLKSGMGKKFIRNRVKRYLGL